MQKKDDVTRVVVTLGPTDETIDDIMKITNMSTGALGKIIAETLMRRAKEGGKKLQLWLVCNKTAYLINRVAIDAMLQQGAHLVIIGGLKNGVRVISETEDMLRELETLFTQNHIDYFFHCAAVGDYTGRYASSSTKLAGEIYSLYQKKMAEGQPLTQEDIAAVLQNPTDVFNQDTKMSSDEPGMIVGLGLTPKVIARINGFAEKAGYKTHMISWKLLSGVTEEELYNVALQHGWRNGSALVVANDLDRISDEGGHWAMLTHMDTGERQYATTKEDIAEKLAQYVGL